MLLSFNTTYFKLRVSFKNLSIGSRMSVFDPILNAICQVLFRFYLESLQIELNATMMTISRSNEDLWNYKQANIYLLKTLGKERAKRNEEWTKYQFLLYFFIYTDRMMDILSIDSH